MSTLRGVKIFGFGSVVPESLLPKYKRVSNELNWCTTPTPVCKSVAASEGFNSPTRIQSSNSISNMSRGLVFNEGLIAQIVQNAEIGRMSMGINDI